MSQHSIFEDPDSPPQNRGAAFSTAAFRRVRLRQVGREVLGSLKNINFPAVRPAPDDGETPFLTPTHTLASPHTFSDASTISISSLDSNYSDSLSESVYQNDEEMIRDALPEELKKSDIAILYNNDESMESPFLLNANITLRKPGTPPLSNEITFPEPRTPTPPPFSEIHITLRKFHTSPSDHDLLSSPSSTPPLTTSHNDPGAVRVFRHNRTVYALSPDRKAAYALYQSQLGWLLEIISRTEIKFAEWEKSELEKSELEESKLEKSELEESELELKESEWRTVFDIARFGAIVQADALKDALKNQNEDEEHKGKGKVEGKVEEHLFLRF